MVAQKSHAWVISVVTDEDVRKGIVVAASLRRVMTTKKIVAVFTPNISDESRMSLREKFDLTITIDQPVPDGVEPLDYSKIFIFSLGIFEKCVYLSTSTLVIRNCDEIFDKYKCFAAVGIYDREDTLDTSVFLFTPSLRRYKAMKNIAGGDFLQNGTIRGASFTKYFAKWLQKQEFSQNLHVRYNQRISLQGEREVYDGLEQDLCIVKFVDIHPIDIANQVVNGKVTRLGIVESFIADKWMTLFTEKSCEKKCPSIDMGISIMDDQRDWKSAISDNEPVAVVGISCRMPSAQNVDEFWDLLIEGREGIQLLPSHRWTKDATICHVQNRNAVGGFLNEPIDEFDAKFFGLSPKEAVFLDPQQRLLHEVTWEALEDASINPQSLRGTHTGVFVGSWLNDYKDIVVRTSDLDFYRVYMGNSIASGAARLSYFFGTTGPCIATESGCSSAIVAVEMGFKSLRRGEVNMAIACGVNLFIHPFDQTLMSMVVAPDGKCKTFDAKANGFGRAEGCGVLLMKRLSDAIRDGDKIWGLIRGSAVTQEGISKSLGTPTVECESLAMELALKDAGVQPDEVSFIETHGTGTIVGDPMEVAAIGKVFTSSTREQPLIIGSVKTNVGHTESCSGVTGIIKTFLAMKYQVIPKHLNFDTLNPEINLDSIPAKIPLEPFHWPRVAGKPRIAGVSSFGISGTDGHVILQEALDEKEIAEYNQRIVLQNQNDRPLHILKITAKSPESFQDILHRYKENLEKAVESGVKFSDFTFSANTGRASLNHRAFILAKDGESAIDSLAKNDFQRSIIQSSGDGKLCFLFTGQGSQYHGMAKSLYKTSPIFKMSFDKCNLLLRRSHSINLKDIMWRNTSDNATLSRTLYSQISIFCVEYCLLQIWNSWGVKPDFVLGHSLGEFAAAVCAGILSLGTALYLVAERSRLIDERPPGKMIVIRADKTEVDNLLAKFSQQKGSHNWLDYAALNSFDQTVLAGRPEVVQQFAEFCEENRVKTVSLAATHAFHSRAMDPILRDYESVTSATKTLENSTSSVKYISGMLGELIEDKREILASSYWVRHTRDKVNFIDACKVAKGEGCKYFVEIGPHPVLSALAMANIDDPGMQIFPSLRRKHDDWTTLLTSLGKLFLSEWSGNISWKGVDEYYSRKHVSLPFYPFNRKKIWAYITPLPPKIHPLLGIQRENPSGITLFENDLTARTKFAPYLQDHVIGSSFVVPGSALLELCLAAGYAHVQAITDEFTMPRRPITLRDLKIESPLALNDTKGTKLQVVVEIDKQSTEETGQDGQPIRSDAGYKCQVYHWEQEQGEDGDLSFTEGHWVCHANGVYIPVASTVTDKSEDHLSSINITEIQEKWQESNMTSEMYKKLPEIGLRFGPYFQSLEKGWKNTDEDKLLVKMKVPDELNKYLAHPVITDGMFQAAVLWSSIRSGNHLSKKLSVPVSLKEFTWLATSDSDIRYVFCTRDTQNEGKPRVTLLDEYGTPLMTFTGLDLIETSAQVVESMIQQQGSMFPTMWEETFRHKPGPLENQIKALALERSDYEEILATARPLAALDDNELKIYKYLDGITIKYFLNAVYDLGWKPFVGETFNLQDFLATLKIVDGFTQFTRFFLKCLATDGYLQITCKDEYSVIQQIKTKAEVNEFITSGNTCFSDEEKSRGDFKTIYELGKRLPDMLLGKTSPLSVLFPDGKVTESPLADSFYQTIHSVASKASKYVARKLMDNKFGALFQDKSKVSGKIRILEVGAGTGMQTLDFLTYLEELDLPYEYHYTDISAVFFPKAQEKFAKYLNKMKFIKFNLEQDPLEQGFCPKYYDLVIAAEVIHATRNIKESLANMRVLMKDNATLEIVETTKQDRRLTFIFGMLEGYWRFQDFDLRQDHATLTTKLWEETLKSCGFSDPLSISMYENTHSDIYATATKNYDSERQYRKYQEKAKQVKSKWVIFGDDDTLTKRLQERLTKYFRDVITVYPDIIDELCSREDLEKLWGGGSVKVEGFIYLWGLDPTQQDPKGTSPEDLDQTKFLKPFLYLSQHVWDNQKVSPRTYVVTRGMAAIDDSTVMNPSPSTIIGVSKVLRTETLLYVKCIDLPTDKYAEEMLEKIFPELWNTNDEEDTVAFRNEGKAGEAICKRYSPRYSSIKVANDLLPLPKGTDRFQLVLPESKMVQDLEFTFLDAYTLGENEIEVKVKANALNFRDLFAVLKPDPQFDKINAIGLDFSGVVTAIGSKVKKRHVGETVFGINRNEDIAFPSHIKVKEDEVVAVPDYLTFAEAATLPAVFATAAYCLLEVAKISRNDTILIHVGSGGVGNVAIQLAKIVGCKTIISTAGNKRKRKFLENMGVHHVFHSRNTMYSDQIMEVTNGRGVDVVLNSLTSENFKEATLKCCAHGARFVEMSKLSVWTENEVKALRPDVKYTIADLTKLNDSKWESLHGKMKEYINDRHIKPTPYVRFDGQNIRSALLYMQKARHIGKIVCIMPEVKISKAKFKATTPLFNDRSTYLITGAINGGIGLETAKYMLSQGAKHLVLLGRSKPIAATEDLLESWRREGYNVHAWQCDVGSYHQLEAVINKIKNPDSGFPPLRGVQHAAGVLRDATVPNQTWDKFEETFNPKVRGAWNLHELTKDCSLEHFVTFSSLAAIFGTPGQATHCAANFFDDTFSQYRYSLGLPATSINWGSWGQVGVATEIEIPGFRSLSTQLGLASLDLLLRSNRVQTGVMTVESFSIFAKFCPRIMNYIDDKSLFTETKVAIHNINSDEFWGEVDSVEGREEKEEVFKKYIKIMVRTILKMEPDEPIDDNVEFQTLGVDSLMLLELKNSMQNLFGNRMSVQASDLKGCNTTTLLAAKLVDILLSNCAANEVHPTMEELRMLMQEDATLPNSIATNAKSATDGPKCPSQIKTLLITGITGLLGPYMLRNVLKMPQISQIVCIVRRRTKQSPLDRLRQTLTTTGLISEMENFEDRVECVEGDVGQSKLGLSDEDYDRLSEQLDGVLHCAAKVDHVHIYRKTGPEEKFHVRNVNVNGMKNILEFVTHKRRKHLFYASTIGTIYNVDNERGSVTEDWQQEIVPERIPLNNGYGCSKYVAEQLMRQAVQNGYVEGKAFRLPIFGGDSRTGWHDIRGNHAMLRYLTFLKVKAMPTIVSPIIHVPVDHIAEIACQLFFNDQAPNDCYNIIPKNPEVDQDWIPWAEKDFGCKIELVEYEEFVGKVKELGDAAPIQPFLQSYENFDMIRQNTDYPAIPSLEQYIKGDTTSYFHSRKLAKYCPDLYENMGSPLESLRRDLKYLKDNGILDKFGIS